MPPAFEFSYNEERILDAMYEAADSTYDSYTLTKRIEPTAKIGTPGALKAFTELRDATERLILRGYVRGQRASGLDGVYFKKLRLTPKGEKAAIQKRKEAESLKNPPSTSEEAAEEVFKLINKQK